MSEYGIIPDVVTVITSATTQKRHTREYTNPFGRFLYRDVPKAVFPYGITDRSSKEYGCFMATPEKAVCDMLYIVDPVSNMREFEELIFDDLRFDEDVFRDLDMKGMSALSKLYRNTNHRFLNKYIKEIG